MNRSTYALGAVAAVLVAAVGLGLYFNQPSGVGGQPSPSEAATPAPTATPSPTATPKPTATLVVDARIPDGAAMKPGSYVTRPLPAPDDGLSLRFSVPAGWHGFGDATIFPDGADGMALQFIDVTSVNSDLCHWQGPDDDVSAGTTVDDLVAALVAQTAYEVSDPIDVSIGGYSGKRVDVVWPAELFGGQGSEAPGCDDGVARLWSTSAHGESAIYGQGPAERWQTNILDVDGTRFVIILQDATDTTAEDRAETAKIVDSMVIEP